MRPWQRRRSGESNQAWHERLNRTCYACGHESPTVAKCDAHEKACPQANAPGRKKEK